MKGCKSSGISPAKLFLILWIFTVIAELISLQIRLAIFGGTGWLTSVKYTTLPEQAGFFAIFCILCASITGLWTIAFDFVGRKIHADSIKVSRLCATLWAVIIAADLILRHKITELLGNAFSFFDFASGVGGVFHMIGQAFRWYGDLIILSIAGIAIFAACTWFFFKWLFKPKDKSSIFERIPRAALVITCLITIIASFLFMSIMAPSIPATQKLLANETMFGAAFNSVIRLTTDFDGDGYGAFDLPPDEAPFDSSMHPHAIDIPDDGIDQDLIAGDLRLADLPDKQREYIEHLGAPLTVSPARRRHVFVVLMESVRYDMLDEVIDNAPVMPEMNKWIQKGAQRIDGFFASRGFTQNSITQTFWGRYEDPGSSLVDDFRRIGYTTAVYSGENLKDEGFDESLGWNRSGDVIIDPRFIAANIARRDTIPARMLMDEAEQFIETYDTSKPLFMYLFYQDPHFPYQQDNPPIYTDRAIRRTEITAELRPRLYRTYASQVHHVDEAAGRLMSALERKGILDDALVIFVSDHGESLFDDGYLLGHGIAISDVMTHGVMAVWGAHAPVPSHLSHIDLRSYIYRDLTAAPMTAASSQPTSQPVMQYIGATSVPTAISWRNPDGTRLTYEFASKHAHRSAPQTACIEGAKEKLIIHSNHGGELDETADPDTHLVPSGIAETPIPADDPNVLSLIRTWEYMQYIGSTNIDSAPQ